MSWVIEWKALSARIHGLLQAGQFYCQTLPANDSYRHLANTLLDQAEKIFHEIKSFAPRFSNKIPNGANEALDRFVTQYSNHFTGSGGINSVPRGLAGLMLLKAFESEMSFLLSDVQVHINRRSERAFAHLKQSIAADPEIRKKWKNAFEQGEVECEKLGASHLLLHSIWAFKANAAGGRTDLVFGETIEGTDSIERAAEGLVLTEWKRALSKSESARRFQEAREQADKYAKESLAGIELAGYRFLVVVTEKRVDEPEDLREGEVVYRHINIAVDPQTPSRG